jgi:sugar phosphate permease
MKIISAYEFTLERCQKIVILMIAVISFAVFMGIRNSFSVFLVPIVEHFHWERGLTAGIFLMNEITFALFSPAVGFLVDLHSPRRVMLIGICLFSLPPA